VEDCAEHDRRNSEFHQTIITASGNRRLQELYAALHAHIKIARIHAAESGWAARQRQETVEHEAILAALEARDGARAAEAVRRHIERAKEALVAALRARLESPSGDGA
jgi:DNA-binding GntR family transcriptional regulator